MEILKFLYIEIKKRKLATIDSIVLTRNVLPYKEFIELHGFYDANEKSYGARIYVRCSNAQCRVALLKYTSISRLELCMSYY